MSAPDRRPMHDNYPAPEAITGREQRALDTITEGFVLEAPKVATALASMKIRQRTPIKLPSFQWVRGAAIIGWPLHVARGICALIARCWAAAAALAQMCANWSLYFTHLMAGKKWGSRRQQCRDAGVIQVVMTSGALSVLVFTVFILAVCFYHQIQWWGADRVGSHMRLTGNWTLIGGELSLVVGALTAITWTAIARHDPKK